jgi:Holliday junction resolvasome RuvABC ATP-dependent DNA helicase subunit
MGIYRVFFHRLRGYPGPFLAKLSQLWRVWRNLREENYLVLDELHRTYGEYVRVGMYVSMNQFVPETWIDVEGTCSISSTV